MGRTVVETEIGAWELAWTDAGLSRFRPATGAPAVELAPPWVREALAKLARHLNGEPQDLTDLPLDLSALTPFQRAVAMALRRTRSGEITYGDLAALAGHPGAARAVGRAVKANALLVLIPCHRVVGAKDGGGWSAFGSRELKARLMALDS